MIGTAHGRTATFTLTDSQMGNILTLFSPLIDSFIERVAQRVKQLTDEAKPRYYSRKEAADLLRVSMPTLHAMINAGALTPKRVGRHVLFDAQTIDEGIRNGSLTKFKWSKKGGFDHG